MSTVIFKNPADESLYEQLVSRLEHIDRAFIVRRHIKLHYAKQMPSGISAQYIKIVCKYSDFFKTYEESLLWYISVELHSRFIAGSKRGLYTFIYTLNDDVRENLKDELTKLTYKHGEVICYIKTQRDKYLAHADDVDGNNFPNLFDKELEALLNDLKQLLNKIGERTKESRRVTDYQSLAEEHTNAIFNDLMTIIKPGIDISKLSVEYNQGVKDFLKQ